MSNMLLWIARPANRKTGPIPTAYVGRDYQETWESCEGCSLRQNTCYAWNGRGRMALASLQKRAQRVPEEYTLEHALKTRLFGMRAIRLGAIGDPARAPRRELLAAIDTARRNRLNVLGYTHFWAAEPRTGVLRREIMASTNTPAEADKAIAAGWRAASVVPSDTKEKLVVTPAGNKLLVCPAMVKANLTCADCRLCDPQHKVWTAGKIQGIAFPDHGPAGRKRFGRKALPTV